MYSAPLRSIVSLATICAWSWTCTALPAAELDEVNPFLHKWASHDQRSQGGDGVGPMHNATSCAACHHQGGPGGGGSREHNVDLLSVVPTKDIKGNAARKNFIERLVKLHPGFADGAGGARPNVVLHRFGPEADYFGFRARLLGIEEPRPDEDPARRAIVAAAMAKRHAKKKSYVETLPIIDGIAFKRSQRNTPALWGAGLIDSIPGPVIEELAKSQSENFPELSGRVPRATGGGVGKFGWRGQTATLRDFVLAACSNELGLQTKGHEQTPSPLASHYKGPRDDLTPADVEAMIAFVANLPRPVQLEPKQKSAAESVRRGEKTFERVGCAACHPRQVGTLDGLFSDLLLHEMGADLEDPVEPNPPVQVVEQEVVVGYSGTGTIFVEIEVPNPELPREWRTPPLWGVKDSVPYLHDGRADTLMEAIAMHGGEAAASAKRFLALPSKEQATVVAFLNSLVAPPKPGARP